MHPTTACTRACVDSAQLDRSSLLPELTQQSRFPSGSEEEGRRVGGPEGRLPTGYVPSQNLTFSPIKDP